MRTHITMQLMDSTVRFTPEGRVAVVDAIEALSASKEAPRIWQTLKQMQPDIAELCQGYRFQGNRAESVVDSQGWERIETLLLDYMMDRASVR